MWSYGGNSNTLILSSKKTFKFKIVFERALTHMLRGSSIFFSKS